MKPGGKNKPHSPNVKPVAIAEAQAHPTIVQIYDPDSAKKEIRENRKLKVEIATLVVIIIYTIISAVQWGAILNSNHIAQRAQRAWIKVSIPVPPDMKLSDITDWTFPLKVINVGQIPARNMEVEYSIQMPPANAGPRLDNAELSGTFSQGIEFPNDPIEENISATYHHAPLRLTEDERRKLANGEAYFAIVVRISYKDDFGPHWTHFCGWQAFVKYASYRAGDCTAYDKTD